MPETRFHNGLSDAETERLALLGEECAEIGKAIGKILRHGYPSRNPDAANAATNREDLEREIGDLLWAIDLMAHCGDSRKVDDDTVLAIRREFGRTPAKTLAERHGTSVQTIRDIGNRRTRKNVSPPAAGSGPQQPEQASGPERTPKAGAPAAAQKPARRLQDVEDTDLSERQVREIRRYAKTAGRTNGTVAKLADEFDVPAATIDAIIERRAWSELQPRDDEYDPLGESVWNGRTPLS